MESGFTAHRPVDPKQSIVWHVAIWTFVMSALHRNDVNDYCSVSAY